MNMKIRCQNANWSAGIEMQVFYMHDDGGVSVASPLTMVRKDPGEYTEPTMALSNQTAQTLMDELWRCGIRPKEGSGSVGSLAATERHLHDMQKIALGLLKSQGV